ncbi:Vacuolar protein sorting-associated protein 17 [Leucoagaricus sp. SymC.cos]|nr:Vacuolar protein sorting-associated protein 17 [Leucoagaricus sp. SymC.cos]
MFDPLNSTVAFGGEDTSETPPWPTTPRPPGSPIPNLRPANTNGPSTPDKGPTPGLYGREPQIYGQPEAGLISPRDTITSNGTRYERQDPYLKVRITGLDRNRRDILVKFDAQTNLSNFTGTTYRNVSRSYLEFQQFYESIVQNNPQTIVGALPLAQTSAPTDEEDDRLVKIMLQRWITRVCEDRILFNDEDVRAFIENDFGYQPTPRPRKKASSGFSLIRRHVPDEDEDLQRARFELTKLEGQFFDAAKAVDKLAVTRKALATSHAEMGNKLINVATTEAHPPLGNALRKLGRAWHSLADLDHAQAISECVILADSLGYQGMNARSAKETLQMRTGVLEEYQQAVKTTISKRRTIERLKASSNIRPEKVDEALADMEEADRYEQVLARRAEGISQNLHQALQTHNRYANDDITTALIEHARSSIMYERQLLKELEALQTDAENAAKKVLPQTAGPPKPKIIPPLEDYYDQPHPLAAPQSPSLSPNPQSSQPGHVQIQSPTPPAQLPHSGSSMSRSPLHEPPLGHFGDGTKSMFIQPLAAPHASYAPQSEGMSTSTSALPGGPQQPFDPLRSTTAPRPATTSPLQGDPLSRSTTAFNQQNPGLDALAQVRPNQMAQSVHVQPTRPRLDAREAASKLANMF